jgi:hypothetical protein
VIGYVIVIVRHDDSWTFGGFYTTKREALSSAQSDRRLNTVKDAIVARLEEVPATPSSPEDER